MRSTKGIGQLGNEICPEHHAQPLLRRVDGGNNIRILGVGREPEGFPEDIEPAVAANESHEVGNGTRGAIASGGNRRGCLARWRAVSGVCPPSLL
jgi:hypothetical protein